MDKEYSYSAPKFTGLDNYSLDLHNHHHETQHDSLMQLRIGESSGENNNTTGMIDYMLNNTPQPQQQLSPGFAASAPFDKLSFADVMQFADFGPKLALNQTKVQEEETGIDPVYFLKFPVLNDKVEDQTRSQEENRATLFLEDKEDQEARVSDNNNPVQLRFLGEDIENKNTSATTNEVKNKRKRPRTFKTTEEVESQRMTHIAVERNRRKQMNEHLRVLRSLMPGSYVQRGDQASIIGGAIEFVRELEQLLKCLESQKRRRILGEAQRQMGDNSTVATTQQPQPPMIFPVALPSDHPTHQIKPNANLETGLHEETAENKSCLADVEVKLLGFDAMIKILSRRRPGQLVKTIAALEDLQIAVLHTNITTIEQTVLYSFNVKVTSETRFTAEDIASSIQQIFSFIHANSGM